MYKLTKVTRGTISTDLTDRRRQSNNLTDDGRGSKVLSYSQLLMNKNLVSVRSKVDGKYIINFESHRIS